MKTGGIDSSRIESMLAQLKAAAQRPNTDQTQGIGSSLNIANGNENSTKVNFSDALKACRNFAV